jgi:hypothetical protein
MEVLHGWLVEAAFPLLGPGACILFSQSAKLAQSGKRQAAAKKESEKSSGKMNQ